MTVKLCCRLCTVFSRGLPSNPYSTLLSYASHSEKSSMTALLQTHKQN